MSIEDQLQHLIEIELNAITFLDNILKSMEELNKKIDTLPDKSMGKYVQMQLNAAQSQKDLTIVPTYKPPTIGQYPKMEK